MPAPGMGMKPGDLSHAAAAAAASVLDKTAPPIGLNAIERGSMLAAVHVKLVWDVLDLVLTPEQRRIVLESLERIRVEGPRR